MATFDPSWYRMLALARWLGISVEEIMALPSEVVDGVLAAFTARHEVT
ncbi:MAG: hypothetical protein ACXWQR_21195 [Ktedonobacterales bacterium]